MTRSKSSTLGIIGLLLGAGGLGLGIYSLINSRIISDDKWYNPFATYGLYGAADSTNGWYVWFGDPDAAFYAIFIVPQTRNDWRICIIHRLTISSGVAGDLSGIISAGAVGNGEYNSYVNIFASVDLDLTIPAANVVYHTYSSMFSATAGDRLRVEWQKNDALPGSGNIYITFALVHS